VASDFSKKRLEKVTGPQDALLRDLTAEVPLDAASIVGTIAEIVADRFQIARGFIKAAQVLKINPDPIVQRSAVSRAYYGAYQAARAMLLSVALEDEGDHENLARKVDKLLEHVPGAPGATLKELRRSRNEFDYAPYPGPNPRTP
jgi:uncharacterized protein (UPF0332 family)